MSNVLLFCMSIRGNEAENYYLSTVGDALFCGISQLEPGTKQLLFDFARKGQIIDRIIVLNTKQTVEEKDGNLSAYQYYISRIKDFIMGTEKCFETDFAELSIYDQENADKLIAKHKDDLLAGKANVSSINSIATTIIEQVIEIGNSTDISVDISEEDKELLLDILEDGDDSRKYDTDKYQKLKEKYFYTDKNSKISSIDALRYRESMYASLRYKYEKQLIQNSKTRHLVILLYKEIELLQREIEKLKRNRERILKQYVAIQIIKEVYDKEVKCASEIMNSYRELTESRFESADIYFEGLFKSEVITEEKISKAADSIPNVLSLIMQEAGSARSNNEACHIYIDTQGGLRTTSNVMNGTLELLKNRSEIVIENSLGTKYAAGNIVNSIEDVSVSQTIFKLVAAMNEFTKTARADSFKEYYASYNKSQGRTEKSSNKEDVIVDVIQNISDSISLCDVNLFEENLDRFAKAIADYRSDSEESKDKIFNYFVDDIEKSYEKVLNNRTVIDEVEWCLDMKLYQQALTLIESKMPGEFVKRKILFYSEHDKEEIQKIKDVKDKHVRLENYVFDNFLNGKKEEANDKPVFCVNYFCYGEDKDYKLLSKDRKDKFDDKSDYYAIGLLTKINEKQENSIIPEIKIDQVVLDIEQSKKNNAGAWTKFNSKIEVFSNITNKEDEKKVGRLLRVHKALKRCRNMTNHASDFEHPRTEYIVSGIQYYIKMVRELFSEDVTGKRQDPMKTKTKYNGPQ